MQPIAVLTVSILSILAGACGSSEAPASSGDGGTSVFPSSTLAVVASDGGKLQIAVRSAPYQPLIAGLESLELIVTDASTGAAIDGLSITMTPWMPAMGHGSDTTPVVTGFGQGRYVVTDVSLFMPGEWQLRTQFSGPVTDSVEPTFTVD